MQNSQAKTEWLGYKISDSGVQPLDEKVQAISDRLRPKTVKELRSLMGALNQLNRFIPKMAEICAPLRPLLSKKKRKEMGGRASTGSPNNEEGNKTNYRDQTVQKQPTSEVYLRRQQRKIGSSITTKDGGRLEATHFASRFLTPFEQKYSLNDLELLAVVWALEKL